MSTNKFDFISALPGKPGLNLPEGAQSLASTRVFLRQPPRNRMGIGLEGKAGGMNMNYLQKEVWSRPIWVRLLGDSPHPICCLPGADLRLGEDAN